MENEEKSLNMYRWAFELAKVIWDAQNPPEYKYSGESILEPIYEKLLIWFNFARVMKEAADKWG